MSSGYWVLICKYTAYVWEGEINGIKLIFLLVMEFQPSRTPQQASAWQWHVFLLAVNTFCTTHKPYQTSRRDFLDFWYIQYYFQVISIQLMSHWKVPCFHWAGVCHMHIVPFCTWMEVAEEETNTKFLNPARHHHTISNWAVHPEASRARELPTNTRLQSEIYLQKVRLKSTIIVFLQLC